MNNVNIIPHDILIVPINDAVMQVIDNQYNWFYIFNDHGSPTHVCVLEYHVPKDLTPKHFVEHNCELHYYFTKEFY